MRMVARKPVSSSTVTMELKIENHRISRCCVCVCVCVRVCHDGIKDREPSDLQVLWDSAWGFGGRGLGVGVERESERARARAREREREQQQHSSSRRVFYPGIYSL